MARVVARLGPASREGEELVAHIHERHPVGDAAAELQVEEAPVPGERFVDVADLERDVVDPDESRHTSCNVYAAGTLPSNPV